MLDLEEKIRMLAEWYEGDVRPFLQKLHPEKLEDLDKELTSLKNSSGGFSRELTVCFLGNSGVGKSTLVNALIGGHEVVVPSGGVGPLTAQALTVKHSSDPAFEVQYHPLQKVWNLIFALEQMGKHELLGIDANTGLSTADDGRTQLYPVDFVQDTEVIESSEEEPSRFMEYKKTAQLIITGRQDHDTNLPYLIDCLREAIAKERIWGTTLRDEDRSRICKIQSALAYAKSNKPYLRRGDTRDRSFIEDLRDHASGFYAPLIKEITVHWNCELLASGIALVDLPGVGIAGDVYREVTRKWIREKAQAVVLVVDHRGVTETVAELLRRSEFLNRLIYSADNPEDDPILMVVMVKIDDIAETRYAEDKTRKKPDHFSDIVVEARSTIEAQIRMQLEAVWPAENGNSEIRTQVIGNILKTLDVHPLSAIQYRRSLANDEDDRAFISNAEQSNVPKFAESLMSLATRLKSQRHEKLEEKHDLLLRRIRSILKVIQAQWQEQTRAGAEAERLREEMTSFMEPLRTEFHVRQGQYRAFLKINIPQRISDLVNLAGTRSQVEIRKYLNWLGNIHWSTLRASVRRDGRFNGSANIDLPREFALRFEEPVAEAWSKQILRDIRRETKDYAQDCVRLVAQAVDWARMQGARVNSQLIEAQYEAIKADAKKLEAVGKEMVSELREEAKNKLIETIEEPIRAGCRRFVDSNQDIGRGVRIRILELYADLSEQVVDTATRPATEILTRLFREVEKEISSAFGEHSDPLKAAAEAIVSSHESYIRRSDAQKRSGVLESLSRIMAKDSISVETDEMALADGVQA